MAEVPGWLKNEWDKITPNAQRWNMIVDFFIDPCEAPVWVYFELAKAPLAEFALAWFTISPQELAENYLKPNHPSRCTKRRGRKGRKRRLPIVRGADEVLADKLPGRGAVAGRNATFVTHAVFATNELIERPLFWLMLFDLGEDFFYNWASAMIKSGYCQEKLIPMVRQEDINYRFLPSEGWRTVAELGPTKQRAGATINALQWNMPGGPHKTIFNGQLYNNNAHPATYAFRLGGYENSEPIDEDLGQVTVPPFGTSNFTYARSAPHKGNYNIRGNSFGDSGYIYNGVLWDQNRFVH